MLASLDFPFSLLVGDLSTMIKGASERPGDGLNDVYSFGVCSNDLVGL